MDETDRVLAARRHADKAASGTGGDDPRLQSSLAQAEAMLAIAAAIDRLADALNSRAGPAPSAEGAPAYQVADIRKQYPNAYTPWTAEADAALLAAHQAGHDITSLAETFGRQPSAVRSRVNRLTANAPAPQPDGTSALPDSGTRP
jgi:hypothetical protein